ncbi:AAA domain-containing protein [Peziza echinospora]|nr:AAA domain-containing protein [Peziza echinospora]
MSCCNIYITGAGSTGKTTLVRALEEYFANNEAGIQSPTKAKIPGTTKPTIITEVARSVMLTFPIDTASIRSNPSISLKLQKLILHAQQEAELSALTGTNIPASAGIQVGHPWFISDRSYIDPVIYTSLYISQNHAGLTEPEIPGATQELLNDEAYVSMERRLRENGLLVILKPNPAFLRDDGVRLMPTDAEEWNLFHRAACEFMDQRGVECVVVEREVESIEDRVEFVVAEWRKRSSLVPSKRGGGGISPS